MLKTANALAVAGMAVLALSMGAVVYVIAVVPASGYFTIYLNKAVTSTTYVGYFVHN